MQERATRCAAGVLAFLVAVGAAACAPGDAGTSASSTHPGGAGRSAGSPTPSGAGFGAAERTRLAPAGPAPGPPVAEDKGEAGQVPAAAALATSIDCEEVEPQTHFSPVAQQLSCRRGTDRVYVLTFHSAVDRDTYLRGVPVVPGGFNVVGSSWVVHVETAATARTIAATLGGSVHPGS